MRGDFGFRGNCHRAFNWVAGGLGFTTIDFIVQLLLIPSVIPLKIIARKSAETDGHGAFGADCTSPVIVGHGRRI